MPLYYTAALLHLSLFHLWLLLSEALEPWTSDANYDREKMISLLEIHSNLSRSTKCYHLSADIKQKAVNRMHAFSTVTQDKSSIYPNHTFASTASKSITFSLFSLFRYLMDGPKLNLSYICMFICHSILHRENLHQFDTTHTHTNTYKNINRNISHEC